MNVYGRHSRIGAARRIAFGAMLVTLLTGAFSGCVATTGMFTPTGVAAVSIYTEPVVATNGSAAGKMKRGSACTMNIFGLVAIGDGGVREAMEDGEITQVISVDREVMNILFLFGKVCTIVRGT
ncbi:MAG: hypothetical protein HYT87_02970 [Nitrospirae bacterium]|nr:hypothetical protein [Nitrospirota bacterium]